MTEADGCLRGAGLKFFGAISASVTHELKNTFAVVREISGLLGDLARSEKSVTVTDLSSERVGDLAGRIGKQVARADAIVKRMNAFAHSVDRARKTVDVREVVELLAALCQRFADMARVGLDLRLPDAPVTVETDAFALQHVLYLPLRRAIAGAGPEARVAVAVAPVDEGVRISVEGRLVPGAADEPVLYDLLAERLGATATEEEGKFVLGLPARMPEEE